MSILGRQDKPHNVLLVTFVAGFLLAVNVVSASAAGIGSQENPDRPLGSLPTNQVQNLVTISNGAGNQTAEHPLVPNPIVVKSGSKVTFVNQDSVTHSIIQGSPETGPVGFDLGVIGPGKNATATINGQANEIIPYYCGIHPFLRGTIQISSDSTGNTTNSGNAMTSSSGSQSTTGGQTMQQEQYAQEGQPQPRTLQAQTGQQQTGQQPQQQRSFQGQVQAGASLGNSSSSSPSLTTFTMQGTITTWAAGSNNTANTISPYLASGWWTLQMVNGTAKSFDANITMVNANGSDYHTHRLSNFNVTNANLTRTVTLGQTGSNASSSSENTQTAISLPGRIDITTNGGKGWSNVPATITISQFHTLYIATDSGATGNHFSLGQFAPGIYGIVESIKDKDGKELFQDGQVNLPSGG